jgi:putative membrane protein (TIGR04086 family)
MNKLSIKGIFLGGLADVIATNILSLPLIVYISMTLSIAHLPRDQMQQAVTTALNTNPVLFSAQFLIGAICSALGGYLAARIAKHDELLNGAFSAWLCIAISVNAVATGKDDGPWAMQALDFLVSPAAGLLGGYFISWRSHAKATA